MGKGNTQNQKSKKFSTYNKVIYVIVIIFFFIIFYENYVNNNSLQMNQVEIYATVYKIDVSSGVRGKKIFEYYYYVNNKKYTTYEFLDNYKIKKGDKILIIYDKDNPNFSNVIFKKLNTNK